MLGIVLPHNYGSKSFVFNVGKMTKLQTSIEFLLILGAVGMLSLGVISLYVKNISMEQSAVNSINLSQASFDAQNSTFLPSPSISVLFPFNSTYNDTNVAQLVLYGCDNGHGEISLYSNTLILNRSAFNISFSTIYIGEVQFIPAKYGSDNLTVNSSILCGNSSVYRSESYSTYATSPVPALSGPETYYASIHPSNEYVKYSLDSGTNVSSLKEWNRCTELGFWGNPYDIGTQCGTYNAWEYSIFSENCYTNGDGQTVTYCITPKDTGYEPINTTEAASYVYSANVSVYTSHGIIDIPISSNSLQNYAYLSGIKIGTATVENVSSSNAIKNNAFLHGTSIMDTKASYYRNYIQASENAYSVLWYYNKSSVSGATQSSIQQAIASFENASSLLIGSLSHSNQSCNTSGINGTCSIPANLSYVVLVNLYNNTGISPGTAYATDLRISIV